MYSENFIQNVYNAFYMHFILELLAVHGPMTNHKNKNNLNKTLKYYI